LGEKKQPILITGATGLLGSYLTSAFGAPESRTVFVGRSGEVSDTTNFKRCDLTDVAETRKLLRDVAPASILHAAAMTNVDLCEDEPIQADQMNRGSTSILAEYAEATGARLVYVSTDAVFDGERGSYVESDEPRPLNEYARSKLRGEEAAAGATDHLVVRTNLFARNSRGVGLVEWILRELTAGRPIVGFADVVFSPLRCADLAHRLVELLDAKDRGIIHVGSRDAVSKLEFAHYVADVYGLDRSLITSGSLADVQFRARRPANTSLDSTFAANVLSAPLPTIHESVARMAEEPVPRAVS
jgi:dTDP-4-dehydrorhamnose reductase